MAASDKVISAARALLEGKCSTIGKRRHGVEMEDGEKGYIVHSDHIAHLEGALDEYDKAKARFKSTATR
jgi:hypothetical protein